MLVKTSILCYLHDQEQLTQVEPEGHKILNSTEILKDKYSKWIEHFVHSTIPQKDNLKTI